VAGTGIIVNSRFPKTMLLSWSIPPAPTGSGVITGNLAKQFSPDEMVVMGARYVGRPPVDWSDEWPRLIYATLQPPAGWRGARWIRWMQWPWLVLRALWTLLVQRCEAIFVVFPDEIYLLAAYFLSLITGRPLFAYFHNTYLELRPDSKLARWLQPRVFRRAKHVFVMSEGMQRLYRQHYPDLACTPLVHTFNDPLPDDAVVKGVAAVHTPLRLAIQGNVNKSNFGAAVQLAKAIKTFEHGEVQCAVYSGTDPAQLRRVGFDGLLFTASTVSRDRLLEKLREADIMLLPHGFSDQVVEDEILTILPTRTIEYLISGRPILAHLPADCFLHEFLARHECALIVTEPDVEKIREAVIQLQTDPELRERLVRQALVAAEQFRAPVVAGYLREMICSKYL
jgi:glycosyltransferase involved in cell wall biosynthesis